MSAAVRDEVIKKATVAWVAVGDGPAYALWCLPHEGALAVVCGPGEQDAPGLAGADRARVLLRGDHGGLVVAVGARVERLAGDARAAVAPLLAAKRLNAPGTAADLVARWDAAGCAVLLLVPDGDAATGAQLPDGAQAGPPRETPARVPTRRPFRLHRVRRD